MKKGLLLMLALIIISAVFASDYMMPGPQNNLIPRQSPLPVKTLQSHHGLRDTLIVNFSMLPITLTSSYYDYMIGAYNDLPMCVEPDGAYFLTFHGKSTTAGLRRVYYGYINAAGSVENLTTITNAQILEGYSSIALVPESGKPVYAWHNNIDTDAELETSTAWDAFLFGSAGLISNPYPVINNPSSYTVYDTLTFNDNEFIWPTVQIGPSPVAGMYRIYILSRNATDRDGFAKENVMIAFADVSIDDLEFGNPSSLDWDYTTIPELDRWNADGIQWRRPNNAFSVGDDGRIYYVGYHAAAMVDGTELGDTIYEPLLDAFVCDNYGEGQWQRYRASSKYKSWNPKDNFGNGVGIFQIPEDQTPPSPVLDDSLWWDIANSSHGDAVFSNGKIQVPMLWALNSAGFEGGLPVSYYYPNFHTVKDVEYDVTNHTFTRREIYPIAGTASDTLTWRPWDENGDWLVDEYLDDPTSTDNGYPLSNNIWPFPYWDSTVHDNAMFFHYNNTKLSIPNEQGMMAAVWQDSNRARLYNTYAASYPELVDFADTPEIYIACSPDNGRTWSDPVSLNKVETPELAGMRPMWVYPADKVKYEGTVDGHKVGKVGIMFYDDFSWGSYAITPSVGSNLGGNVKFMELNITFPLPDPIANGDQVAPMVTKMLAQNYPNPFNPETTISFTMPAKGKANLSIYNVKGQLVSTLVNGPVKSGTQKLVWDGKDSKGSKVASGIYFYKLNANGKTETRKMMLMK